MTAARWLGCGLVLALLAGTVPAARADKALGVAVGWGQGMVPAGYGPNVTTELVFRDHGGTLSMLWFILIARGNYTPQGKVEGTGSSTTCTTHVVDGEGDGTYDRCVTTRWAKITPPSQEELDAAEAWNAGGDARLKAAHLEDSAPFYSSEVRLALPWAGGHTTGFSYEWMLHSGVLGLFGMSLADLGLGIGGAVYHYGDLDVRTASLTGPPTVEPGGAALWGFAGFPIRVSGFVTRHLTVRLEYDFNLMSVMGSEIGAVGGSVFRAGLEAHLFDLMLSGQVSGQALSPDRLSYTGAVSVVF